MFSWVLVLRQGGEVQRSEIPSGARQAQDGVLPGDHEAVLQGWGELRRYSLRFEVSSGGQGMSYFLEQQVDNVALSSTRG